MRCEVVPAAAGRHRHARRPSACARWRRCSAATSWRAWTCRAAPPSAAGWSPSAAAFAPRMRRCWSTACTRCRAAVERRRRLRWSSWLALAPFDRRAHELLLDALARSGRLREGEEHLAATARQFEAEGQDWAPDRPCVARRQAAPCRSARSRGGGTSDVRRRRCRAGDRRSRARAGDGAPRLAGRDAVCRPHAAARRCAAGLGDGLAYDIITRLAKLRSMFVIAQGTVFALDERRVGAEDAGRRLDVDYVASGSLRREAGGRLQRDRAARRDAQRARAVGGGVRRPARRHLRGARRDRQPHRRRRSPTRSRWPSATAPSSSRPTRSTPGRRTTAGCGTWCASTARTTSRRAHFFQTAVRLDPTFARPYAGLSFTHFQNAFLGWRERDSRRRAGLPHRLARA